MIALKILNVSKKYKKDNKYIQAVDNISYTFEYGKMYAIMGHSGSGKSTLIQCIGLLDTIDCGDIFYKGKNIKQLSEKEKNNIRNETIGFVFQDYYLNSTMKAYENVLLPMLINKKYNNINVKKIAYSLLDSVGLQNRYNHYPKELSGGEQQRVAIARAIANNPDIILADEPTGNLDENNERYIIEKLKELSNAGKCVIIVSHNNIIKNYADIVINMKKGKFVQDNDD